MTPSEQNKARMQLAIEKASKCSMFHQQSLSVTLDASSMLQITPAASQRVI